MLNLLFISDSPKVEFIKAALQPSFKVIIDVVTDFDHGLKDVFEKRPATVCIQDQIGGVTGESVARHIQMLLGNSSPTFILLHGGSAKAKTIRGLYDYVVDLSLSNEAVLNEMMSSLKSLLGEQQWEKIYITPLLPLASDRSSLVVSIDTSEDADKLVDDFLTDLETSGFTVVDDNSSFADIKDIDVIAGGSSDTESPEKSVFNHAILKGDTGADSLPDNTANENGYESKSEAFLTDIIEPIIAVTNKYSAPNVVISEDPVDAKLPLHSEKSPIDTSQIKPLTSVTVNNAEGIGTVKSEVTKPLPVAEFKINQNSKEPEEQIPDDLLMAFEDNYRSRSHFMVRVTIIVVLIIVAGGGWFYVKKKPALLRLINQTPVQSKIATSSTVVTSSSAKTDQIKTPDSANTIQPVVPQSLPAFIPKDGLDSSYASKNPGWERYVGKLCEFRVFRTSGRIQAIQVLSVNDAPMSEAFIKSVFKEFVGSPDFRIVSRNTKAGVLIENGKILNNGEVIIYRKNGVVKAFVASVN